MYKYLHSNGKIIDKVDYVVDSLLAGPYSYFEGPFVLAWWHINDETGALDKSAPPNLLHYDEETYIKLVKDRNGIVEDGNGRY
jgi:hypothetical protein